jgi:RNA polymerase sigma factor (sigma-70 family)
MVSVQDDSDTFLPTRSSLLSRLRSTDDSESWRQFFQKYRQSIHGLALKCGLTHVEAEEVVQETMVIVAQQMPDFQYDRSVGSFKGWLFTITRRAISKHFNKRRQDREMTVSLDSSEPSKELDNLSDPAGGLEQQWNEEWRQNLLTMAMDRVRRRIKPKQYQMFDLYVTQQLPMEAVTRMLNVNSAQVYMAKLRVSGLIRQEVAALEQKLV